MKSVILLKDVDSGNLIAAFDSQESAMIAKKKITSVIDVPFVVDTDEVKLFGTDDKEEIERIVGNLYNKLNKIKKNTLN